MFHSIALIQRERESSHVFSLCMVVPRLTTNLWWLALQLATNLSLFEFHRKFLSTCKDLRVVWTKNTSRWKSLVSKFKHGGLGCNRCCFEKCTHSESSKTKPAKTKWEKKKWSNSQIHKHRGPARTCLWDTSFMDYHKKCII